MDVRFVDADDLHPRENIDKMARGESLEDEDRWGWLETVRRTAVELAMDEGGTGGVVVACSALKKAYRDVLRGVGDGDGDGDCDGDTPQTPQTRFVFLTGTRDVLAERMERRRGHFMLPGMLDGQLATLESPVDEPGVVVVVVVPVEWTTEKQVDWVVDALAVHQRVTTTRSPCP